MNVLSVVYRSDVIHYQISTRTTLGGDKFYIDGLSADFDYLMDVCRIYLCKLIFIIRLSKMIFFCEHVIIK